MAAVPGTVEPDPEPTIRPGGSGGGKGATLLGSTSLDDVAGPAVEDEEPDESDFEADADAEGEE